MAGNGLWRTKSIEQSIADTDEPDTKLRKDLTAWDLTVFGVAVVIGAGIFTVTASTAGNVAGPSVVISFIIAAIACGLAALCYAEFASTVPVAGSAYTFSYATFGEFVAWIIGWDLVLEFALAAAVVAKGWSAYLSQVLGLIGLDVPTIVPIGPVDFDWGTVLIVLVLGTLLAVGTKLSSRFSQVIT
ncbi:MAG TPA: amino acid permease, partial [Kutzneria sp.]